MDACAYSPAGVGTAGEGSDVADVSGVSVDTSCSYMYSSSVAQPLSELAALSKGAVGGGKATATSNGSDAKRISQSQEARAGVLGERSRRCDGTDKQEKE